MILRNAIPEDIDQLIDLFVEHAAYEKVDFEISGKKEKLNELLFSLDNSMQCIVVEKDAQLVGYATYIKQLSTWRADFYLYLDCLFLKENVRGKGIGRQLMNKVCAYAIQENCSEIQWQTPDFNSQAISFYKKIVGAKPKTKERFFWSV